MYIKEILTESLSPIVYHYTGMVNAINIIESGKFELSSVYGSIEQDYAPKGYPYFLSTTRTKLGGYHQITGYSGGVLFTLNGNWYNRRYPSRSVDYWGNRDPTKISHRSHEAEDRLFSREPSIPIDGVINIHVLTRNYDKPEHAARARRLLIAAKRRGIKTYLYTDQDAWRLQDTRNVADVSILSKGSDTRKGYVSTHRGYLMPWIEIIKGKDQSKMSSKARDLIYTFRFRRGLYRDDMVNGLANDLGNARKPDSGPDRKHAITIINFMKQNKLSNVAELIDFISKKYPYEY